MSTEEHKPELKRGNSIALSVYTGYGQAGVDKRKEIQDSAAQEGRSTSNFLLYLYGKYKK